MSHLEVDEGDPKANGCVTVVFVLFVLYMVGMVVYHIVTKR